MSDQQNQPAKPLERKYVPIPLTFRDIWEERDVELNYRFAKPTKMEIKRLQDTATRNGAQAARNILISTVHPEDKDALMTAMDDYPGIAMSYSTALIKAVGLTADAGN